MLILTDEHRASALSCAGHEIVRTPNLDRLAARGTRFLNAYTPSPICVPARAALATGRPVHETRHWDNAHAYDGAFPSWGHELQAEGIPVTSIGKLHYRNEDDSTGFGKQILPMHIMGGIGQVWGSVRNPLPARRDTEGMLGQIGAGLSRYNRYDMNISDEAYRWLLERGKEDEGWAAMVSFVAPHFPLTVPQEYLELYPAEEMPLPEVRPANGYRLHPWVARMNDIENSDAELGTDARRQEAIAAYFGLCTFVDAQIGKVLDALDESGQSDDTLVIYTSDHGENLGMRGRWGKSVLYRESTQVPMMIAGPGIDSGKEIATPVSLLDVAPTMTRAFGLKANPDWSGRSLSEIAKGTGESSRMVHSEYHATHSPSAGFMITDGRWKFHHYVGYEPELFDLHSDPLEVENLASDPACSDHLTRLETALRQICDPEEVDRAAKADQDRLVSRFGGPEIALYAGTPGATPVPGELA